MSHRPRINKQLNRMRKMMRTPLPVNFDLVDYLKLHRHAQTTGEAERLILGGRVRNGSHTLGIVKVPVQRPGGKIEHEDAVQRVQPAHLKDGLIVL